MEDEFAGNQHSNHDCSNEKNIDNVLASHIPLPLRMDLETDLAVRLVLSLGRCQRQLYEPLLREVHAAEEGLEAGVIYLPLEDPHH